MILAFLARLLYPAENGFNFFTDALDISHGKSDAWTTISVSRHVPPDATGVILDLINTGSNTMIHAVRKKGSPDNRQEFLRIASLGHRYAYCGLDQSRGFESYIDDPACKLYLLGYTDAAVFFFDNSIDKSITVTGAWTEMDVSPDGVPREATGIIMEIFGEKSSNDYAGLRPPGSRDDRTAKGSQIYHYSKYTHALCGIDTRGRLEAKIESTNVKFRLLGYTLHPVNFFANAVKVELKQTNAWYDLNLQDILSPLARGVIMEINNTANSRRQALLRRPGSRDDRSGYAELNNEGFTYAACGLDEERVVQAWSSFKDVEFHLVGYCELKDTTPPAKIAAVTPGQAVTYRLNQLQATWQPSRDAETGIAKYWYAIGSKAGAADIAGWTDNGPATSVIRQGLRLTVGRTYYFAVKAENSQGLQSQPAYSPGITVSRDTTPPAAVSAVWDGLTGDADTTYQLDQLSGSWQAAVDPESGLTKYWYSIGTRPGAVDVRTWTDNGSLTYVTAKGLVLKTGMTYYFTVKAENGQGLQSTGSVSDGLLVLADRTPPGAPAAVRDGREQDLSATFSVHELSANWDPASDKETAIRQYWYAIGTRPGADDTVAWTANGPATRITHHGLNLTVGRQYFFSVKAENAQGLLGVVRSSDGITVRQDTSPPQPVAVVTPEGVWEIAGLVNALQFTGKTMSCSWPEATDSESGIARYWFAIGTSAGAADLLNWTDTGAATRSIHRDLHLKDGQVYYGSVKAENNSGLLSPPVSTGGILITRLKSNEIIAASGSSADLQTACDRLAAPGGGTVYLPAGDFPFTKTVALPGGINLIGAGRGKTILRSHTASFLDINHAGTKGGAFRITGIDFYGNNPQNPANPVFNCITLANIRDFRIDHCYLESFKYAIIVNSPYNKPALPQSRGVIDHCSLVNKSEFLSMYGISDSRVWDEDLKLGSAEATFIEDCYFERCSHPSDAFGGGHYVLRYSTVYDCYSIGGHGPGFDSSGRGTRCSEIYHNLVENSANMTYDQRWTAMSLRGGGGVIFGNTIINHRNAILFTLDRASLIDRDGDGKPDYPGLDQIHDRWLWDNQLDITNDYIFLYGEHTAELIKEGRDYFLRAPNLKQDGFTYTPYPYPHPLTRVVISRT